MDKCLLLFYEYDSPRVQQTSSIKTILNEKCAIKIKKHYYYKQLVDDFLNLPPSFQGGDIP